jgi:hypothetical protein
LRTNHVFAKKNYNMLGFRFARYVQLPCLGPVGRDRLKQIEVGELASGKAQDVERTSTRTELYRGAAHPAFPAQLGSSIGYNTV